MKKIAWITDSTCGLSEEFVKENDVFVLPLSVMVNGVSYKDNVEITSDEFYEKLKKHGEGATTSQPAFGDFIELYKKLKTTHERGIAIHPSSELTGTYNSSINASSQVGFPVEVIDSRIGSYALGKMISNGIEMEAAGKSYESIVEVLRTYPSKAQMYLLPSSLGQLQRSGRVSTPQAIFASLLNINILLKFEEGKVVIADKIRTKRRAKRKFFDVINEAITAYQLKEICVIYAGVKDKAQEWKEELENLHDSVKFKMEALVPVAGVHTGHGTISVAWLAD